MGGEHRNSKTVEHASIGVTTVEFESEEFAPEVDWDLLRSLIRGEVDEALAADTYRLVHTFKSWHAAHTELLIAEAAEPTGRDLDSPDSSSPDD